MNMFRIITIRELLLLTAVLAICVVEIRERFHPNPLDAYEGLSLHASTIAKWAKEVDGEADLVDGKLFGGFAAEKLNHNGYAILDCQADLHGEVIQHVEEELRGLLTNTGWKQSVSFNDSETFVANAWKGQSRSQIAFHFLSHMNVPTNGASQNRLTIYWVQTGVSPRITFAAR